MTDEFLIRSIRARGRIRQCPDASAGSCGICSHRHDAQNIDLMGLCGLLPQLSGRLDPRRGPAGDKAAARELIHHAAGRMEGHPPIARDRGTAGADGGELLKQPRRPCEKSRGGTSRRLHPASARWLSHRQPIVSILPEHTDGGRSHRRPPAPADRAHRTPRGRKEGHRRRYSRCLRQAKAVGYDVKIMRQIPPAEDEARRAREQETMLDTYKAALGMG